MLGKLMKYEIKATSRVFLPLFLALLAFALINRFIMGLSATNQFETPAVISMGIYVVIMVGMFVMTLLMTIQRFYKNLLSEEGYLMFTLPVKPWQHILSKMLVSMLWVVSSILIAMLSIVIIALKAGDWARIMDEVGPFLQQILDYLGASLALYSLEAIVGIFLSLTSAILIVYAAISMGHLFTQHRILASFAAFIVLNTLTQILSMVIMVILGYGEYNMSITPENFHLLQGQLHFFIFLILSLAALISAAYFAIANWILNKRLNLE